MEYDRLVRAPVASSSSSSLSLNSYSFHSSMGSHLHCLTDQERYIRIRYVPPMHIVDVTAATH